MTRLCAKLGSLHADLTPPNADSVLCVLLLHAGGDLLKTVKVLFDIGAVRCRDSPFLSQVSLVELEERGLGNRVSLNWLIKKNGPSFSLLPLI